MKSLENRIDELDFLRGIAILMVMVTHTNLYFPNNSTISSIIGFGRFGVQLFFVISAFTMANVYLKNNNFNKGKFYIKRIFRIFPLFFLASIIYLPSQIHPHYWNPEGLRFYQYILSILFLQGISPDSINSVVPGGWSIANEMNFYFIFPFILKYINKWKCIILFISLSYFTASFVLTNIYGDMPKYLVKNYFYLFLPNQLNVFLFGILAAYWIKESKIRMGDMIFVIFYLFIVLFSCIYFNDFNHIKTILVGIFFSLIVYFFVKFSLINFKLLSTIGKMTYTSYLLHFGILMLFSKFLNEYLNFYSAFLLVSISTFFIAFIIKPYIEDMWVDFANKMFQKNL